MPTTSSPSSWHQSHTAEKATEHLDSALRTIRRHVWRPWWVFVPIGLVAVGDLTTYTLRTLDRRLETPLPAVPTISLLNMLADPTPIRITITAEWQKVSVTVPAHALTSDATLWQKMNFDDWDTVPEPLRRKGLTAMWDRYAGVVHSPPTWDRMTAYDWDTVPQPIRAMAYIEMTKYWSGYYQVGTRYGLPRGTITNTMAAIVMAESWFEHRGTYTNPGGGRDIGLGGSSEYCRTTMERLWRAGAVDFVLSDDQYFDPWQATRVVAVWFELMLEEADGDLDLAVRTYHRGWPLASRGEGEAYLANVKRLRLRYIRNEDGPPAWQFLFARAFGEADSAQLARQGIAGANPAVTSAGPRGNTGR